MTILFNYSYLTNIYDWISLNKAFIILIIVRVIFTSRQSYGWKLSTWIRLQIFWSKHEASSDQQPSWMLCYVSHWFSSWTEEQENQSVSVCQEHEHPVLHHQSSSFLLTLNPYPEEAASEPSSWNYFPWSPEYLCWSHWKLFDPLSTHNDIATDARQPNIQTTTPTSGKLTSKINSIS